MCPLHNKVNHGLNLPVLVLSSIPIFIFLSCESHKVSIFIKISQLTRYQGIIQQQRNYVWELISQHHDQCIQNSRWITNSDPGECGIFVFCEMIDWMIWTITYQTPVSHICSDYSHIELRVRFISFCIFSIFTKCTGASAQKVPESDKGPPLLIKSVRFGFLVK